MAERGAKRSRSVFKGLWLSDAEWARVQRRMEMAGMRTFADYARYVLTEGKIVVRPVAFDPAPLRIELSRIGNNVNQIARNVNMKNGTTFDQMRATRELLRQIQRTLDEAMRAAMD